MLDGQRCDPRFYMLRNPAFDFVQIDRAHHSKPVKKWVAEHAEKIELFYLPSYSPELNPEDQARHGIKSSGMYQSKTTQRRNTAHDRT